MARETPQEKQERQVLETRRRMGGRMSYTSNRRNQIADYEDSVAFDKAKCEAAQETLHVVKS